VGQSVIDFVTAVFGAELLRRFDGDGHIMHAEMRIDDSVIMLADAHGDWPAVPAWRTEACDHKHHETLTPNVDSRAQAGQHRFHCWRRLTCRTLAAHLASPA
jgi:uncharacterized glyoxalase superfamily protein PhnB